MVAANKVNPILNANYPLRRRMAKEMRGPELEVFGPLWTDKLSEKIRRRLAVAAANLCYGVVPNPISIYGNLFTKYPSAHGAVTGKHVILQETKFSLVIENSNAYVSENFLDAIINGSIPIHFGPCLSAVGLPSAIAIRAPRNPNELSLIIGKIDWERVESTLFAIREFIHRDLFWKV